MKVQRDGRSFTVEVTADEEGLVSHAGSALLSRVADKGGLTGALSQALSGMRERGGGHDPGRVVRDLAVMLAELGSLRPYGHEKTRPPGARALTRTTPFTDRREAHLVVRRGSLGMRSSFNF